MMPICAGYKGSDRVFAHNCYGSFAAYPSLNQLVSYFVEFAAVFWAAGKAKAT